jgi:hypothetical protein
MLTLYFWLLRCMCEFSLVEENLYCVSSGLLHIDSSSMPTSSRWSDQGDHLDLNPPAVSQQDRFLLKYHKSQVLKLLPVKIPTVSTCTSSQSRSAPSHHANPPAPQSSKSFFSQDLRITHPTPPKRRHTNKKTFPFFLNPPRELSYVLQLLSSTIQVRKTG